MTATDELRRLLDERGVESGYPHTLRPELHKALMARGIDYWVTQGITFWNRGDGCECLAYGYEVNGVPKLAVKVVGFTDPEQAIAAALESGTCRYELRDGWYKCSNCGRSMRAFEGKGDPLDPPNYCPNCGRKVVSDG